MYDFTRRDKKIKIGADDFLIRQLWPADFLDCELWPFTIFLFDDKEEKNSSSELDKFFKNRQGIKPKSILENEERTKNLEYKIILRGCAQPIITKKRYEEILQKEIKDKLIFQIFILSYEPKNILEPFIKLNRDFMLQIYWRCKEFSLEPYSFFKNNSEKPEFYNPYRYDFNSTVFSVGCEWQKKLAEEKSKEMRKYA